MTDLTLKITGMSWFNRMEVGVKEFGAANPGVVNARQIGLHLGIG